MLYASNIYFSASGKIDTHNQIQEECGIDKCFCTNNWSIRVNFSILLMIYVDTWLLYKACHGESNKHNPKTFFMALAAKLADFVIHHPTDIVRDKRIKTGRPPKRKN